MNNNRKDNENSINCTIIKQADYYIRNYKELGFDTMPYLHPEYADKYPVLVEIQEKIKGMLGERNNFECVSFTDVQSGGIQINVMNKRTHLCMAVSTLNYDFSNISEAIDEVVRDFITTDDKQHIKKVNHFYDECSKYGWD